MKEMNDILHSFEDDGYAVITGFFPAEIEAGVRSEIENWVDRYARQLVAEGHIDRLYDTEPFETVKIGGFAGASAPLIGETSVGTPSATGSEAVRNVAASDQGPPTSPSLPWAIARLRQ